jgi:hypothetical protein
VIVDYVFFYIVTIDNRRENTVETSHHYSESISISSIDRRSCFMELTCQCITVNDSYVNIVREFSRSSIILLYVLDGNFLDVVFIQRFFIE